MQLCIFSNQSVALANILGKKIPNHMFWNNEHFWGHLLTEIWHYLTIDLSLFAWETLLFSSYMTNRSIYTHRYEIDVYNNMNIIAPPTYLNFIPCILLNVVFFKESIFHLLCRHIDCRVLRSTRSGQRKNSYCTFVLHTLWPWKIQLQYNTASSTFCFTFFNPGVSAI